MAEVLPRNVLLRVSPRLLQDYNTIAVAGAGRGRAVPLPYTFTRNAVRRVRGPADTGRKVAANKLAISYPAGLVDQFGNPVAALRFDGARTQLVTDPENFGAWTVNGTVGRTGGQSDPFGGTNAYLLDSNATAEDNLFQVVTFAGNATKAILCFIKEFSSSAKPRIGIDNSAIWRHLVEVTWVAGVPTLATIAGTGTLFSVIPWGGGWYAIAVSVDAVVAAETNRYFIYPDHSGNLGATLFFGANAWNASFPSSYQGPGESAGAADNLTVPCNWGPLPEMTVLTRQARPVWGDGIAALGVDPLIYSLGGGVSGAGASLYAYHGSGTPPVVISAIDTPTGDQSVQQNLPAGAELVTCQQYRLLTTGGKTKLDVGSGFGSESGPAPAFLAFQVQTLRVGGAVGGSSELYSDLIDLIFLRGLFTRPEALAASNA